MTRHPIGKGGHSTPRLVAGGRLRPPSPLAPQTVLRWGNVDLGWDWPACRLCRRIYVQLDDDLCDGCRDELAQALDERRTTELYEAGADVKREGPQRLADVRPFHPDPPSPAFNIDILPRHDYTQE